MVIDINNINVFRKECKKNICEIEELLRKEQKLN